MLYLTLPTLETPQLFLSYNVYGCNILTKLSSDAEVTITIATSNMTEGYSSETAENKGSCGPTKTHRVIQIYVFHVLKLL